MRTTISLLSAFAALALAARASGQGAQLPVQESRFLPPIAVQNGFFGQLLSLSGDTLAVGMPGAFDLGADSGAVYIWRRVNGAWQTQPPLHAPDEGPGDKFSIVDVQGDTLAVGAPFHLVQGVRSGAVYIYKRIAGTWTYQAQLQAPGVPVLRTFGASVSLDGNRVLIGASGGISVLGTAYTFTETGGTWSFEAELPAGNGQLQDNYGLSVCVRGDTALVGAPRDDIASVDQGSVYVFGLTGTQWSFQTKLTASDATSDDGFGKGLDFDGSRIAVGAATAGPSPAYQPGAVYLFENQSGSWIETLKLQPTALTAFSRFGESLHFSGDRLVVGAPAAGNYGGVWGAVYFYQEMASTWLLRQRVMPQGYLGTTGFGAAVGFDGELLAIGAPQTGESPPNSGALHTYRFTTDFDALCFGDGTGASCPCSNTTNFAFGMGCSHSGGRGARLLAEGTASVAADTVVLHGSELPAGFSLYLQANSALNVGTGLPFKDGLLCVGGALIRMATEPNSAQGEALFPGSGTDPHVSVRGGISPGDVRYYQIYFRDNASFCTSAPANLSNAIRITWQP